MVVAPADFRSFEDPESDGDDGGGGGSVHVAARYMRTGVLLFSIFVSSATARFRRWWVLV